MEVDESGENRQREAGSGPPARWPLASDSEPGVDKLIGRGCAIVLLALVAAIVLGFIQNVSSSGH